MSLADDIREFVAIADEIVKELEPEIQHLPFLQQTTGFGRQQQAIPFGEPIIRRGLVEERYVVVHVDGVSIETHAKIYFLEPIPPLDTPQRANPVDPRDIFILPSGRRGPVVHTNGFLDAGTGRPFISEVYLGKLSER
jgi:hypothetical protein